MLWALLGCLSGAYLRFVPVSLSQPDGSKPELFATGDEYYNWLHDKDGFTVKQNDAGWYVYLDRQDKDELVFTSWVAGRDNPAAKGLQPWTNLSPTRMGEIRKQASAQLRLSDSGRAPTSGTLNNLAIFIRFSDQSEYTQNISTYNAMFNGTTGNTMQSYFWEVSYNTLNIPTTYYPAPATTVISWQDSHPRAYYSPYSTSNTIGYNGDTERTDREFTLLVNAVNGVSAQVPTGLNLDGDGDGMVDNVCFIIQGGTDGWAELLWPHRWSIYDRSVYINSKRVYDFNFQLSDYLSTSGVGVLCHEMFHSLGAPDLYHYSYDGLVPVGPWDVMENDGNPPQHMSAYMKYRYGHWISEIPELTADGTYSLNALTSATNNCYKIASPNSGTEYFVVEYRRKTGTFENSLPGSGLLVYRVNPAYEGNADGPPDELYLYRPGGTTTVNGTVNSANYSAESGRTAINSTTNPTPFLTNGSAGGLNINTIGSAAGTTISFVLGNPIPGMPTCQISSPADGSGYDMNSTIPVNVTATDTDGTINNVRFYIDDVLKSTDSISPWTWNWNTAGYSAGSHIIKAIATDNSSNTATSIVTVTLLTPADEGFETGNFNAFAWNNSSAVPWTVQSSQKYSGTYAAKAGSIGNSASTTLSVTLNVTAAGDLSYFYKVSSESGYDYLRFYLDGVQQTQWAGEAGWAMQSHTVGTGLHTFAWTYSKDGSTTSGSDTAWLDHIIFPEFGAYYPPPRNLSAVGGDGFVNLSWQAPDGGVPTSYRIFKNGSELTTTTNLYYTDNAVTNGVNYSYYLTAVYSGGESDPTATVNATPNVVTSVTIGSGTSSTGTSAACPINVYYQSLHGQSVYTKAELNAAGATGPIQITQLGFNVTGLPTKVMPNFVVRMKHTTATNVAAWIDNSNLVTVYSGASYQPTATGWNMLNLTTPFTWNGTDNILVDTAFGLIGSYNASGIVQYTTVTSGYRYIRSDTVDQTSLFTGGSTATTRPNIKLTLAPLPTTPQISVSTISMAYGPVLLGSASTQSFSITNSGSGTLLGTITTPTGYTVALQGAKATSGIRDNGGKNSLPYSVGAGLSATFDLTFTPTEAIAYNGNVSISHNAEGAAKTIAVSGNGVVPLAVPFAEGFEAGMGGWILANGSQTNSWARGTATAHSGGYSLYVSNDGGTSNAYTLTSASVAHAYCNVSFPAGTESWKLRFAWKGQGEGTTTLYDYLRVYLAEDTVLPAAGTELSSGQLGTSYNLVADWQEVTLDIPAGVNGQNRRLVFSWRNDSSLGTLPPAAIDDIRIVPGSQSDAAVVIDNTVSVEPPAVTDPASNVINTSVEITGITATEGYALVITGYDSVEAPYENAGLDITITGLDFAGSTVAVGHDLGFIPLQISYRVGDGGSWNIVNNPGGWTASSVWLTLPSAKAEGDVYLAFPNSGENTLPVELSSFTAIINANSNVLLTWVTQSEDNCLGYHIFRNTTDGLDSAIDLQVLVQATNTSQQQVYAFEDTEIPGDGTYYYWLQSLEMDGGITYYGPISVLYSSGDGGSTPGIPLATELLNAYPNPFNPSTTIRYSVLLPGKMRMDIFNARGQKVRGFSAVHSQPGFYSIAWDGKDEQGRTAASGVYLYRMSIGDYHAVKRMVLSK